MKKYFLLLIFVLLLTAIYAKTPVSFDRISLDDDKNKTIKIIEKEFHGRFTISEYGDYVINIDEKTSAEIYFEEDTVSGIWIEHKNYTYAEHINLINRIIKNYGEPKGTDVYEDIYTVYWWPTDPAFDLRITITPGSTFTVQEAVFYGK